MGIDIDRTEFTAEDYLLFEAALEENLKALGNLLGDPEFGDGPASMGAELEMYIVDHRGRPLSVNDELLAEADDPQLTPELNRYNLEFNVPPFALGDAAFRQTEDAILRKLAELRTLAGRMGGRIVPIGILPTLKQSDFGPHCITDRKRYHALVAQLIKRRGSEFKIDIFGDQPLALDMADITLEGANTSFQVHYRVSPQDYADAFNAVQLVTPLVLAMGANSPTLFGHKLWHETRIPLFKQSIDTRHLHRYGWNEPARVHFGHGWARRGVEELFRETVRLYPPLIPIASSKSSTNGLGSDRAPSLAELRLHQSTVWQWNRPVYDDVDGGHLRIEMRALPAGPTAVDMVANAALIIGLAEGIKPWINDLLPALPFQMAEYNFYRAAQYGPAAKLVWPRLDKSGCEEELVSTIMQRLLPFARDGLASIGTSDAEISRYLGVIEERLETGQTGAVWQQNKLAALERELGPEEALHQLLEAFMSHSEVNLPVAKWGL
jgi:gamma-glutamyl:cysteine ligase YbdK (ATP-grasp superfamily)